MKKLSFSKKLLLACSIAALAIACQSKPARHSAQPAQSLNTDVEEQGEEDDEESSFWDQTESFKNEEKQLKTVSAPAPVEQPAQAVMPVATTLQTPDAPVVAEAAVSETARAATDDVKAETIPAEAIVAAPISIPAEQASAVSTLTPEVVREAKTETAPETSVVPAQ